MQIISAGRLAQVVYLGYASHLLISFDFGCGVIYPAYRGDGVVMGEGVV